MVINYNSNWEFSVLTLTVSTEQIFGKLIVLLITGFWIVAALPMSQPVVATSIDRSTLENMLPAEMGPVDIAGERRLDATVDDAVRQLTAQQSDEDFDDMEVAETHLFRPLFRYRAQMDDRRRRRINDY